MLDYRTIVAATDLSDPSLPAVREAVALSRRLRARLVVTYVVEQRLPALVLAHSSQSREQILEHHERHAKQLLDDCLKREAAGIDVEGRVRKGTIHEEIVALAREVGAAMIVVGMHGHGFLTHALAGSNAERVLHHAPCPVLVVGHPANPD